MRKSFCRNELEKVKIMNMSSNRSLTFFAFALAHNYVFAFDSLVAYCESFRRAKSCLHFAKYSLEFASNSSVIMRARIVYVDSSKMSYHDSSAQARIETLAQAIRDNVKIDVARSTHASSASRNVVSSVLDVTSAIALAREYNVEVDSNIAQMLDTRVALAREYATTLTSDEQAYCDLLASRNVANESQLMIEDKRTKRARARK